MRVSVAISVFNGEGYIGAAIDSILAQAFADFELLVIDDGSTDRTLAVLNAYDDPRLRIIMLPANCGTAIARNVAMACVRGDYLAVMDADDIALPERLGAQVRFLDEHPEIDVLGARTVRFAETVDNEIDRPLHPLADGEIKANLLLLNGTAIVHPTMMVRMAFVREHRLRYPAPPRGGVFEDHAFWIKCVALGAVFRNMPDVLLLKRRHTGNVTLRAANPVIADRRALARAELLGLYYPELTGAEARALALLLEPEREASVLEACLGVAAGHKAMAYGLSRCGESKEHVRAIVRAAVARHVTALGPRR